jgi:hypothetical protein
LRFVVTGEWGRNALLRLILLLFLFFVLMFWGTNWILYFRSMTLDPASVVAHYLGDPSEEFGRPPRPLGALAEVAHFHVFAMGMLVMTLTHLLLFLPFSPGRKAAAVIWTFASALADEVSGWLVRLVSPDFAWLKVAGFLSLQASLLLLVVLLAWGMARPGRNAYADTERPRRG